MERSINKLSSSSYVEVPKWMQLPILKLPDKTKLVKWDNIWLNWVNFADTVRSRLIFWEVVVSWWIILNFIYQNCVKQVVCFASSGSSIIMMIITLHIFIRTGSDLQYSVFEYALFSFCLLKPSLLIMSISFIILELISLVPHDSIHAAICLW